MALHFLILPRMVSTVVLHTNGFGLALSAVVVFDGRDQFLHAAKNAAAKALLRQLAEPALDEVEPRGTGGREVQLEARVGGQPLANRFMLVGSVVVQDDVQGEVGRTHGRDAAGTSGIPDVDDARGIGR